MTDWLVNELGKPPAVPPRKPRQLRQPRKQFLREEIARLVDELTEVRRQRDALQSALDQQRNLSWLQRVKWCFS